MATCSGGRARQWGSKAAAVVGVAVLFIAAALATRAPVQETPRDPRYPSFADPPFPRPLFNCPELPPPPPATNVNQLRFGNIKVVMAMGDSITAGFGMLGSFPADLFEARGLVYSIGGDATTDGGLPAITLPRWLLHYNPELTGQASGITLPMTKGAYLDAGVSMARASGLPSQIDYLVNAMKTEYKDTIDFENDWKLLTILIGANNLCSGCTGSSDSTPANFGATLRKSLAQIKNSIPRVFVNVMSLFNISGVYEAGKSYAYCEFLWKYITPGECPCLLKHGDQGRQKMDDMSVAYNRVIEQVASEFTSQATGDDQFTVSVQTGLSGIDLAQMGGSFLSSLDCFHPSLIANEFMTYALWNNMQEAPGRKTKSFDPANLPPVMCPTADTFIQ